MLAYLHGLKFGVRLRVLRTVLTPASVTFSIIPTHLWDARFARPRLSRVRSAAVTWISRCCLMNLLTFYEFEYVMRAVEKVCCKHCKTIWNNVLKLMTRCIIQPTASVLAHDVIKLQLVNKLFFLNRFYTIRLHFASALVHKQFSSLTVFVPFSCGCCWFTETAAAQQRDVHLRAVCVFFKKKIPRNTSIIYMSYIYMRNTMSF